MSLFSQGFKHWLISSAQTISISSAPKGVEQSLYGLIPTKGLDIPFLFHLNVMCFLAYSCAVQIQWESRLGLPHVWLLFLMENFHKYLQHCHSHGTLLYGISWFLLQDLDHSQVMWSPLCIYSNWMLIEGAFLCKSVLCHSKIRILVKLLVASSNFWWGSES